MSKDQTKKGLARINTARKIWYKIIGPKLFGQMELGETYLSSPETAIGRSVKVNLKDLTGNVKDQNAYVNFVIDALEGTTLKASVSGYELMPTSVKRMVRKNTNRLDDYLVFKTKDEKTVILKTLLITQAKAQHSVQKQLRQKMKLYLSDEIKRNTFETVITNLVSRKIQISLKKILYKIYPVNEATVRILAISQNALAETKIEESMKSQGASTTDDSSAEETDELAADDETALSETA